MMRRSLQPPDVLVVGDTAVFSRVVASIIADNPARWDRIRYVTYDGFRGMLNPRLLRETDLFIFDLWRTYPTGIRAEGLVVAEELLRLRSRALVVSPLSLSAENSPRWYWDLSATDSIQERCKEMVQKGFSFSHSAKRSSAELRQIMHDYLAKPQGHGDDSL